MSNQLIKTVMARMNTQSHTGKHAHTHTHRGIHIHRHTHTHTHSHIHRHAHLPGDAANMDRRAVMPAID